MELKTLTAITTLYFSLFNSFSQNKDFIIHQDNDTIYGKVIKFGHRILSIETDSKKNFPKINSSSQKLTNRSGVPRPTNDKLKKIYLKKVKEVYISNTKALFKNALNIKIEKPEEGYAHVYFYRPYVYTGSGLSCKISYNGQKFINLKSRSYFLHKIKANELHTYKKLNSISSTSIKINAENGGIYFVKGFNGSTLDLQIDRNKRSDGMSTSIYLDDTNHNKYHILKMRKKSPQL